LNLYETQNTKKRRKSKIVRTADYKCAYVSKMTVLITFPVFLQTVINLKMLSIENRGSTSDSTVIS